MGLIGAFNESATRRLAPDGGTLGGLAVESVLKGLRLDQSDVQSVTLASGERCEAWVRPLVLTDGSTGGFLVRVRD